MVTCLIENVPATLGFHPLGRVGLLVAKSVCVLFVCLSPSHKNIFEASHWPPGHMIRSWPLIGRPLAKSQ